jgi:hypothetical protein
MAERVDSIRRFLITEVLRFVERASNIPGVRRIALIGSLTTDKQRPKDADVLVWLADDADLGPLAVAGRQLNGKAQSRGSGADIFLADTRGNYLGRVCHWRDCRFGVRMSCDALHCGRRQFLHDDLAVVKLPAGVIEAPTLELWPAVVRRGPIPPDVEELLANGLTKGVPPAAKIHTPKLAHPEDASEFVMEVRPTGDSGV